MERFPSSPRHPLAPPPTFRRVVRVLLAAALLAGRLAGQRSAPVIPAMIDRFDPFRLPRLCQLAGVSERDGFAPREKRLEDSVAAAPGDAGRWRELGCVRALGMEMAGLSGDNAPTAFLASLALRPGDSVTAMVFAAAAFDMLYAPWYRTAVAHRDEYEIGSYESLRAGVTAPIVVRACGEFAIEIGDLATAQYCWHRALVQGPDSAWALVRLAWNAWYHGEWPEMTSYFDRAIGAANDSASRGELLDDIRHLVPGQFDAELAAVMAAAPDSARIEWVHAHLADKVWAAEGSGAPVPSATRAPVDSIHYRAVLAGALSTSTFVSPLLALCPFYRQVNGYRDAPSAGMLCQSSSQTGLGPIDVIGQLYRLWDPSTGQPRSLVVYAARQDQVRTPHGVHADTTAPALEIRVWDRGPDRWIDTTFAPDTSIARLHGTRYVTGTVWLEEPLSGIVSLTLSASGPKRYGHVTIDPIHPLAVGPVRFSDIIVGVASQHLARQIGTAAVPLAPVEKIARRDLVQLYYQTKNDGERQQGTTAIALRRIEEGVVDSVPVLALSFAVAVPNGVGEFRRELNIAHLDEGSYQLEVRLQSSSGMVIDRKTANLYVLASP